MPVERQLAAGCEDAHIVVRAGIRWREEKRRFREVGPARERSHLRFAQSLSGMHHRERVSAQRICREDIDLRELKRGHTFGDANYKYTDRYITASENQSPATFIFSINKLSKHFAPGFFQYTCTAHPKR